jgi:nucleotide-binding universal stress UspA family protein
MDPVLLATDGSPTAAEATNVAIELAAALEVPLLVVSCWDISYQPAVVGFAPLVPDLDRIEREKAEAVVEEAAAEAREAGVSALTLLRRGDPAHRICEIASDRNVRLIVIGSHGWGAMKRLVFGSVSTAVLHHAERPVLVVPGTRVTATNGATRVEEVGAR